MMGVYRTSVRFNLRNEREKRAADYLRSLKHGGGNRFIVDAVLAQIEGNADTRLVEQIRRMFREEISTVSITAVPTVPVEQEPVPQADASVLDDLKMFD